MDTTTARKIAQGAGNNWFDPDTMSWWRSIVHDETWTEVTPGVWRFVSSEQMDDESPRLYTVRELSAGHVSTVGEFAAHETLTSAAAAALSEG